ncbi:hypothetical protein [Sulfurovum mangrovi]|uniref:hypothetical protein n=1 Tax=Sulfurovum mangrovi TaxID=2893889 RepID=UPI001E37A682|nr:hypothetical protein [Sulfurovum mangrovi]UFH60103.1 hypothetical protein LN246_04470 [Sulfurovum mangrovi]
MSHYHEISDTHRHSHRGRWERGEKRSSTMPVEGKNNFGVATYADIDKRSFWEEGGWLSERANKIPGMNAIAGLHDVFQIDLDRIQGAEDGWMRSVFNAPAMIPAAAITTSALMTDYTTYLIQYESSDKRNNR